jgi:polysaccharide biosynthesis/export protein
MRQVRSFPIPRTLTNLGLLLCVMLSPGCAMTPGRSMSFLPEGHRLLQATKRASQAASAPQPLPRELDKRVLEPYVVEPGDVLLVLPADIDSPIRLPADQPVLPDGTINLGRYGHLLVAGRTVPEIENLVRAAVETRSKDAGFITVRLVSRQSKVFYVLGEVNAPGAFPLQGRETVLDALLVAGGLTDRASRRRIVLSRPTSPDSCRVVLPIRYSEIVQLGDTSTNYQIAPGDRVYVPTRTFWEELCHCYTSGLRGGNPQVPCATGAPGCVAPAFGDLPAMTGAPLAHPISDEESAAAPAPK